MLFLSRSRRAAKRDLMDVDDASVGTAATSCSEDSTMSARAPKSPRTAGQKAVSFDESNNVTYFNSWVIEEEDLETLWYRKADYRLLKKETVTFARRLAEIESDSAKNPASFSQVMERAFEACTEAVVNDSEPLKNPLSLEDQELMTRWVELAPARIGIEKWSVKKLNSDKYDRRQELTDLVYELQDVTLRPGMDRADFIRKCCECVSRPSRLYAHVSAVAQSGASCGAIDMETC